MNFPKKTLRPKLFLLANKDLKVYFKDNTMYQYEVIFNFYQEWKNWKNSSNTRSKFSFFHY